MNKPGRLTLITGTLSILLLLIVVGCKAHNATPAGDSLKAAESPANNAPDSLNKAANSAPDKSPNGDSGRSPDTSKGRKPMEISPTGYFIKIDKSSHTLSLYRDGALQKDYTCAVGKGYGDKVQSSGNQTPEGNFYIDKITDSSAWEFSYPTGPEKAYGPWFLRLVTGRSETFNGEGWTGIGIHGTSRPKELGTHASHGCIRLSNENILELKQTIEPQFSSGNRVKVLIVP